ncbi:hypothetical protein KACHI17_00140 [Sediminibacterium sp. KACHI17]|uniref:Uncharacterized protein n=1 Tax=Sediminibacterium sp. KACHI17 TaxID=1751071 RepID=A0AAT9GEP2_9BACT
MKVIRYLILFLTSLLMYYISDAQGVKMMSNITTNSPDDLYATHVDSLGKGGFMAVPTKLIRDQLSNQRRKIGMLVYVSETDSVYQLIGGIANTNWIDFKLTSTPSPKTMGWQGSFANHPSNPQVNWAYYNTTDFKSYIWTGSSWMVIAQDGNPGPAGVQGPAGIGIAWKGSLPIAPSAPELNWAYYNSTDKKSYIWDGSSWQMISQDGINGSGSSLGSFNGNRPITLGLSPFTNVNPGTNDIAEWIQKVFYPSQGPIGTLTMSLVHPITSATISGSSANLEMMASGVNIPVTLSWTAGRQASTEPLASVTVGGVAQTFTQPAQNASINGSVIVSVPRNTNTSFSNQVLTTDGKSISGTPSVSVNFSWRRYYGFIDAPVGVADGTGFTPSASDILALSNKEFGSSRGVSSPTLIPTAGQRLVIAYPAIWDAGTTKIWIGGLESSGNFQRQVVSFTNASGASTNYVVYVLLNNTSGQLSFIVE